MPLTSIGDLSQSLMMRYASTRLKSDIGTLTRELSSGRMEDIPRALGGDLSRFASIETTLRRLDSLSLAASEAAVFLEGAQSGLTRMHTAAAELGAALLMVQDTSDPMVLNTLSSQAQGQLDTLRGALNMQVAHRNLFSGAATDTSPLPAASDILQAVKSVISGLTTSADIRTAAEAWFDDPTGFRDTLYTGADAPLAPFQVGTDAAVSMSVKADDPVFRHLIMETALAALATDTDLGLASDTQQALLAASADGLWQVQTELTGAQAELGQAEARIEEERTRNETSRTSLDYARSALIGADPYETATRLEEAQFRLEALYSVTARNSRLSLVNYLP